MDTAHKTNVPRHSELPSKMLTLAVGGAWGRAVAISVQQEALEKWPRLARLCEWPYIDVARARIELPMESPALFELLVQFLHTSVFSPLECELEDPSIIGLTMNEIRHYHCSLSGVYALAARFQVLDLLEATRRKQMTLSIFCRSRFANFLEGKQPSQEMLTGTENLVQRLKAQGLSLPNPTVETILNFVFFGGHEFKDTI